MPPTAGSSARTAWIVAVFANCRLFFQLQSLGGQWSINADMALAVDLGVQLPIPLLHGGTTEIVQDQPDGTDLSVDDSDALYRISGMLVPQIALIRFIWYIR